MAWIPITEPDSYQIPPAYLRRFGILLNLWWSNGWRLLRKILRYQWDLLANATTAPRVPSPPSVQGFWIRFTGRFRHCKRNLRPNLAHLIYRLFRLKSGVSLLLSSTRARHQNVRTDPRSHTTAVHYCQHTFAQMVSDDGP